MSRGKYVVDKIHDYVMDNDEDLYLDFDDYRELDEYIQGLQPVVHAKWINITNKNGTVIALRCSSCEQSPKYAIKSDWCPNCGARMDG